MKTVCVLLCAFAAVVTAMDKCPGTSSPQCGADGKVYLNDCVRKLARVDQADSWEVCRGHPFCPSDCTMEYDPVCGIDRKVYGNYCEMQYQNCGKQMFVLPREACGLEE